MTDRAGEHWASRHVEHARKDTRSDAEVAGEVRMLVRSELMHEMIVARARDRIALLSYEATHAAAIVAEMQQQLAEKDAATAELRAEVERYRNALEDIKKHQEWMSPRGMANITGAWSIADKALTTNPERGA
jgi:hypothetical protein